MFAKLTTVLGLAALIGAATSYGAPPQTVPGGWSRETRQAGSKVTVDVYHRAPYALTGGMPEKETRKSGPWMRETRQVGGKVTVDVYRR